MDGVKNVFNNAILPFDFRRDKALIQGGLQLITLEVLVAKIIRKILGMGGRGIAELATIHTLSLPFLGGLSGFFAAPVAPGVSTTAEAVADGAKGVPACCSRSTSSTPR